MVWPTLGLRTAKEQISTEQIASTAFTERSIYWFIAPHFTDEGEIWHADAIGALH